MRFGFVLLLFATLCTSNTFAQEVGHEQLVQQFLDTCHGSGIAVGIIHNGKTEIITRGTLSKDASGKIDTNTIFEIGSITKVFTASVAACLEAKGALSFDDSLAMYFPANEKELRYQGQAITLLNLLQHTSGLPRIPGNLLNGEDISDPYLTYNLDSITHFFATYHPMVRPGDTFSYSNLGYGVMGEVMALKENKDYNYLVQEYICRPLKMKSTSVALDAEELRRLAAGYTKDSAAHYWHFGEMAGAGGLHSSLNDMLKFARYALQALKDSTSSQNDSLQCAIRTCTRKTTVIKSGNSDCGLAWIISSWNHRHLYWHNGGTLGFRSFIGLVPGQDIAIVVLSNSDMNNDPLAIKLLVNTVRGNEKGSSGTEWRK